MQISPILLQSHVFNIEGWQITRQTLNHCSTKWFLPALKLPSDAADFMEGLLCCSPLVSSAALQFVWGFTSQAI